ncbi:MAG: hypothetical protein EHM79_18905 [Geobacter sp.]|nr:MAG: hypothetical protein EHM79_18905 [Geobacter sp.]
MSEFDTRVLLIPLRFTASLQAVIQFMIKARILLLIPILLMVMGCTTPSKILVGLQAYKIDPQQIDGTWINSDGAVAIKVIENDKGIVRMIFLDNENKPEIFNVKGQRTVGNLHGRQRTGAWYPGSQG